MVSSTTDSYIEDYNIVTSILKASFITAYEDFQTSTFGAVTKVTTIIKVSNHKLANDFKEVKIQEELAYFALNIVVVSINFAVNCFVG